MREEQAFLEQHKISHSTESWTEKYFAVSKQINGQSSPVIEQDNELHELSSVIVVNNHSIRLNKFK